MEAATSDDRPAAAGGGEKEWAPATGAVAAPRLLLAC
jgi:hypothetical protein